MRITLPKNFARSSVAALIRALQMNDAFKPFADASTQTPRSAFARHCRVIGSMVAVRWTLLAMSFVVFSFCAAPMRPALAEGSRGIRAYYRGDYAQAVRELTPAAMR